MPLVFILHDVGESIPKEAARLINTADALNELLPVLNRIAEDMMLVETKVFHSGGRRGGGSWKKLKDDTIKRKGSTEILVETGALKASLTRPGAQYQVLSYGNGHQIEFGTDHPYALFHDEGTSGGIPPRPLIKLVPGDPKRWSRWIVEYIARHHSV